MEQHSPTSIVDAFSLAEESYRSGDFESALRHFFSVTVHEEHYDINARARAHNYRAIILEDTQFQDYKAALEEYNRAIELNSLFADAYYNRAYLLEDRFRDYQKALEDYNRAIELKQDSEFYNNRAILLKNHFGEYQKSLEDFNTSIQLNPHRSSHYKNRGILLKYQLKRYEEAIQDFDQAIRLSPSSKAICYVQKSHTFLLMGNLEEAKKWYEKASKLNNGISLARYVWGCILEKECKWKEAVESFISFLDMTESRWMLFEFAIQDTKLRLRHIVMRDILPWQAHRLIWIGHLKQLPQDCPFAMIPREMVVEIIRFLKEDLFSAKYNKYK